MFSIYIILCQARAQPGHVQRFCVIPALLTVCTTFSKLARNISIQWPHTWLTTIYTRFWAALRGWDPPPYDRSSMFSNPWTQPASFQCGSGSCILSSMRTWYPVFWWAKIGKNLLFTKKIFCDQKLQCLCHYLHEAEGRKLADRTAYREINLLFRRA